MATSSTTSIGRLPGHALRDTAPPCYVLQRYTQDLSHQSARGQSPQRITRNSYRHTLFPFTTTANRTQVRERYLGVPASLANRLHVEAVESHTRSKKYYGAACLDRDPANEREYGGTALSLSASPSRWHPRVSAVFGEFVSHVFLCFCEDMLAWNSMHHPNRFLVSVVR